MPVSRQTTDGLSQGVVDAYGRAETRMLELIARHLADGTDAPDWVQRKLLELATVRARIKRLLLEAQAEAVTLTGDALTTAYIRGQATAQGDLSAAGVDLELPPTQAQLAVQALVADSTERLTLLGVQVLRSADDAYRQAVALASSDVLLGAGTRLQAAQSVLDRLASRGVGGFTDRAGRTWSLSSYAEMATRTATARASVEGHLDRLSQAGIDLVMVSNSPRECETCRPWEGKVLSRVAAVPAIGVNPATGQSVRIRVDGTVDQATSAGLFHPNCTHSLGAYLPGITKVPANTANPKGDAERQQLRALERKTREWKRRQAVAITPDAKAKSAAKVREWQSKIKAHTDAHPTLLRQRQREQITRAR